MLKSHIEPSSHSATRLVMALKDPDVAVRALAASGIMRMHKTKCYATSRGDTLHAVRVQLAVHSLRASAPN